VGKAFTPIRHGITASRCELLQPAARTYQRIR